MATRLWVLEAITVPKASWDFGFVSDSQLSVSAGSETRISFSGSGDIVRTDGLIKIRFDTEPESRTLGTIELQVFVTARLIGLGFEELKADSALFRKFALEMNTILNGHARSQILRISQEARIGEIILPLADTPNPELGPQQPAGRKTRKRRT